VRAVAGRVAGAFHKRYVSAAAVAEARTANSALSAMTWEEKRALVEAVFGGKAPGGKRMGGYIEWVDGGGKGARERLGFRVAGRLNFSAEGATPQADEAPDDVGVTGDAPRQGELLAVTHSARCLPTT